MSKSKERELGRRTAAGDSGVRKQTVILLVLLALGAGFLGGVSWTIYRQGAGRPVVPAPAALREAPQRPDVQQPSPEKLAALRTLQEAAERDPNDVQAWIKLGNLQFDLERPHAAIEAYEKALALQPGNADVLTDMGIMYRRIGRPEKAVELFREAHAADPNHFACLYNLGVVLLHDLRDQEGAIKAWEEYLRQAPQGPQADRIRSMVETLKEQKKPS
jgi:cytochrome c-type biogenesis protein CcmH/NrfG